MAPARWEGISRSRVKAMLEPFVTIEAHRALVSGTSHEPPPLGASGCVVENWADHLLVGISCDMAFRQSVVRPHIISGQKQPACASREEAIG